MRDSFVTKYRSPAATPDSSTIMRSAAMSVNPSEPFFFCPICLNSCPKALLIAIAECHIARADRSCEIQILGFVPVVQHALRHDHEVDLLHQVRGITRSDGVGLVGVQRGGGSSRVINVIGELQVDDVIGHRDRAESVDLAHQARSLAVSRYG